ncbi:hypothetical protein NPX13_g10999 [Xylaria arbuscula]|uniref:Transcription factor domain-containing protein n=1 Tax=Xylaria arbuscula TaxID=114810 RepID=A0A9W8THF2_9PEZI|nr:hypothetical protein NPX13_g10999 [Xylaria arbuscula]
MAVAAVGSQYAHATMGNEIQEEFYSIAKTHSDFVITRRPLEGVKVCTLLCMYNVFAKATVSLAYADAGLGMCDRFGLHCQRCQLAGIEDSVWVDYRKTWRTLIFLSTWLSATLGYRTGNDQVFRRIIALSELHIENQADVSEAVQTEMAKIAVLKARILHMDLSFQYLAPGSLNSMTRDLQACASDPVASRFLDNAQGIYGSVLEHIDKYTEALEISNDQPTAGGHFSDGGNTTTTTGDSDLDGIPASYERSAKELICELLEMLCRPFRHPSQRDGTKESLAATHQDSSQYEHPVLMERIEWDFEDSSPFRSTSAEVLGIGGVDIAVPDPGEASTHDTYLEPEPLP